MKSKIIIIFSLAVLLFSCESEDKIKVNLKNTSESIKLDSSKILKIGVAAMLSPREALPVYEEIIFYIGEKLHVKTEMVFTKDYTTMNELLRTKKVFAAFVCSGAYVIGHEDWNMELIVAPCLHGEQEYYSYIIVHKNSPFLKFEDLKGKRFAFTDPKSNTGRLVPVYELSRLGQTPETFFSSFFYTGSHDKSIDAVSANLADGASVDHLIWEYMQKTDSSSTSKTRIIEKYGPFCIPPVVMHPETDKDLKEKVKTILLEMDKNSKGKEILNKLLIDRFQPIEDKCYESIREMNKNISNKNKSDSK